jgi:hypothetical protein
MLPGSGKTFINSALAYTAKDRRIGRYAGPVAGIRSGRSSSPATGRKAALSLTALWEGISRPELPAKLAFTAWRTWHNIASNAEALLFEQPNFLIRAR